MAEPLKTAIGAGVVASIREALSKAGRPEPVVERFEQQSLSGLDRLELLERGRHIADALREALPEEAPAALQTLVTMLGPELPGVDSFGMAPFRYLPHTVLIGRLGPSHPEEGLHACYEVTKRFTAEWCLRPILLAHPDLVFQRLTSWATDSSPHVRRLVSEGTRPRLPWAQRIPWQPRYLELLETLKDDTSEYVRRSVANHLGDVAKDDTALVVERATRWLTDPPEPLRERRERLVRHALRHPIKLGHEGALALIGFSSASAAVVDSLSLPAEVKLGETLHYTFELLNPSEEPIELMVDIVIGYRKARGTLSPKVFKLTSITLSGGERRALAGELSMRDLSTRKHHPGEHTLSVQINGQRHPPSTFVLLA